MQDTKNPRRCLHCARSIDNGVAYISAGALLLDKRRLNSIHSDRQLAFMNIGFHGKSPDMSDSADATIVSDLPGGQFDLSFCSLACLRRWFVDIVDRLEADIAAGAAKGC